MAGTTTIQALRSTFQIPDAVIIIRGPGLTMPPASSPAQSTNFQIDQTNNLDPELYRSVLGTPVYTNVEFLAGQYETSTPGVFKQFGPMVFEAVLITVGQAKKIIKTEIQGRDGTVKEYIGMDDYSVTINGIITGANGQYPIDDVSKLKKILDAPIAIEVASRFLQNLGIHTIVVEEYNIEQKEGGYSYQTFSISCVSDVPQELKILNV